MGIRYVGLCQGVEVEKKVLVMISNGYQVCGVISGSSPKKYVTYGIELDMGYSQVGI